MLHILLLLSVLGSFTSFRARGETVAPINSALERRREISAQDPATPLIQAVEVDGRTVWVTGQSEAASLPIGSQVTVKGYGFGAGPDVDFSKLMLGNARVLERDLPMYEGKVSLLKQLFF